MGLLPTGIDIQRIAVSSDFIFTATKCGVIEVWLRERMSRVGSIKIGSRGHAKITCLVSDMDGGMLYAASSDGKIQVRTRKTNTVEILRPCFFLFTGTHSVRFFFFLVTGLGSRLKLGFICTESEQCIQ